MAGVQVESVGAEWLQSHLARKLVRLQFTGMLWLHSHLARKLVRLVYRYVADPGLVLCRSGFSTQNALGRFL